MVIGEKIMPWTKGLGILPVLFSYGQAVGNDHRFAMLDGRTNSFCLDFGGEERRDSFRSEAWSSNMNAYLFIDKDVLNLYRINNQKIESIPYQYVIENIERFSQYLYKDRLDSNLSALRLVLRNFRIIRNEIREENSAQESLSLLIELLKALSQQDAIDSFITKYKDIASEAVLCQAIEEISKGLFQFSLTLNPLLLLRHCSGPLFEEANYIANLDPQLNLFPNDVISYEYNSDLRGVYYTPSYVARSIVEESIKVIPKKPVIHIFDPACGSGEFLLESLRQLKLKGFNGKIIIRGWDISSIAVQIAREVLQLEKKDWGDDLDIQIDENDSLTTAWPESLDYVFMNPPFIAWEQMSDDERDAVRTFQADGRPNMAGVFYKKAVDCVSKSNGTIGCLLPASILSSQSGSNLREESFDIVRPRIIGHLGTHVFKSAFADVCFVVARKEEIQDDSLVQMLWTRNVDSAPSRALQQLRKVNYGVLSYKSSSDYSIYSVGYDYLKENSLWLPIRQEDLLFKKNLDWMLSNGKLFKAGALFDIKQGARTGANGVFIISAYEYEALPKSEKKYFRPTIDSSSLNNGIISKSNYLFYPYPEDLLGIKSEDELKTKVHKYYTTKLLPNKKKLLERSIPNNHDWWHLTRPRPWQFNIEPKMVSTEFGHSGNFGFDAEGIFVIERGSGWFFIDKERFSEEDYYGYLSIFNSRLFDRLLLLYSKQLAVWFNLEAQFIKDIPLPDLSAIDREYRAKLIYWGHQIVEQKPYDIEQMELLISNLYGETKR